MNMRSTFMLMAATVVAPLCAQQPTESAADVFRGLASPQTAAAPSTAEQRAAAFPMLRTIPADVDAFCAFTHLGEHLARIQRSGRLEELTGSPVELPEAFLNLEGFSLALGKGSAASLEAVSPLLTFLSTASQTCPVSWRWAMMAEPSLCEIIYCTSQDTLDQQGEEAKAQMPMPEVLVHPIYAVVSFRPTETMVKDWGNSLISMLQGFAGQGEEEGEPGSAEDRGVESVEINGMSGIRIKGSALVSPETPWVPSETLPNDIAERTFYVLMKVDATSITTVICERPEEIRLASTPKESILASDLMAPTDAHPGLISVGYANPELTRWNSTFSMASYVGTAKCFRPVFEKLEEEDPASQEAYRKAAAAITFALGSWEKMSQMTPGKPTFMQCWAEADAIELESITPTAQGVSYGPTRLRLTGMADAPDTIFYAEGGGVQRKEPLPSLMECLNGALDVVHGTLLTLPVDEYSSSWQMAMSFLPECRGLASALQVIGSGLTGSGAVVVDAGGSLPASLGGIAGNKIAIPRFSFCAGVSDRTRLAEGWKQILSVAGNVATKLGQNPAVVGMLPIMPANAGNAVSYSVALPFFTEDMVPNATVSDTSLALGTSSKLNERVVNSATGNMDFVGAVFSFNPAPLASSLRGIADSLAAALPSEADDDDGRRPGEVDSEDGDESNASDVALGAAIATAAAAASTDDSDTESATDDSDTCVEAPIDDSDTDTDEGAVVVEVSTAGEEKEETPCDCCVEGEYADDKAESEGVVITEEATAGETPDSSTTREDVELTEREVAELEATQRAESAEQAAQVAEFFARWAENVRGVVVPAGEGSQALRIRIRLR